MKIEKFSFID